MEEPKKETAPPEEPKALTLYDVNAAVAEAVTEAVGALKTELSGQLEAALTSLPEQLQKPLEQYVDTLVAKTLDAAGGAVIGAEAGVSQAVRHELHVLHGFIENVATTVERSIGQRVSRTIAPPAEGESLPSEIHAAPAPAPNDGPETAASVA